jgi:hypothetical protein
VQYLDIPLRLEHGRFDRAAAEDVIRKYVNLFFASRKFGAAVELDFGLDPDGMSWSGSAEFLRLLVTEFNRVHQGRMALQLEGGGAADPGSVSFVLRRANQRHQVRLRLSDFTGA